MAQNPYYPPTLQPKRDRRTGIVSPTDLPSQQPQAGIVSPTDARSQLGARDPRIGQTSAQLYGQTPQGPQAYTGGGVTNFSGQSPIASRGSLPRASLPGTPASVMSPNDPRQLYYTPFTREAAQRQLEIAPPPPPARYSAPRAAARGGSGFAGSAMAARQFLGMEAGNVAGLRNVGRDWRHAATEEERLTADPRSFYTGPGMEQRTSGQTALDRALFEGTDWQPAGDPTVDQRRALLGITEREAREGRIQADRDAQRTETERLRREQEDFDRMAADYNASEEARLAHGRSVMNRRGSARTQGLGQPSAPRPSTDTGGRDFSVRQRLLEAAENPRRRLVPDGRGGWTWEAA